MTEPVPVVRADGFIWHEGDDDNEDRLGWAPHESVLEPVLRALLPRGGVFVDVGAHVGHWTIRLAPQASKVIAVEANPDTARVLRLNVAMNELRNVTVHQAAAWDSNQPLELFSPDMSAGRRRSGGMRTLEARWNAGGIMGTPLDDLLRDEPRIDLVKIDVEGADLHVLRGMRATIARLSPVLFIELHHVYHYYELADMEKLIADLGYRYEQAAPLHIAAVRRP